MTAMATTLAGTAALTVSALAVTTTSAQADGPGVGTPWVVSVGDSYISGEAGRWAGNTNNGESIHDATGNDTYWDNAANTAEVINRCHRSESAEIYLGGGINGHNLACSGAETSTVPDSGGYFKPGLDFYDDGAGKQGQAKMLQAFAATHNVKMVSSLHRRQRLQLRRHHPLLRHRLPGFAVVVAGLLQGRLVLTTNFTSSNVTANRNRITNAFQNVRTAMRNAGYAARSGRCSCRPTRHPSPTAPPSATARVRLHQAEHGRLRLLERRRDLGQRDALPRINNRVRGATQSGLTNIKTLDLTTAFNGRRLCENTVGLLEEKGLPTGPTPAAVDKTEWVNQIRTVTTCCGNYYIQESLHPNYWGQLAMRNCVRQAWNAGVPKSGTCVRGTTGLTTLGEPRMTLQ